MESDFKNRMHDLAERAYRENKYVYSDFLGESELSELLFCEREFAYAGLKLYGGAESCTRKIARFGILPSEGAFPIKCLKISPKLPKFAENLTHRDFLGAILGLGLERHVFGDLYLKEKTCYCFCLSHIAPFVCDRLESVGRTAVTCSVSEEKINPEQERESCFLSLSSLRADCFVSAVFRLSRADALELFRGERVFLNGRLVTENAKELKSGDCISVRGKGKFYVGDIGGNTKKGKLRITVEIPK